MISGGGDRSGVEMRTDGCTLPVQTFNLSPPLICIERRIYIAEEEEEEEEDVRMVDLTEAKSDEEFQEHLFIS